MHELAHELVKYRSLITQNREKIHISCLNPLQGLLGQFFTCFSQGDHFRPGIGIVFPTADQAFLLQGSQYFGYHHAVGSAVVGDVDLGDHLIFSGQPGQSSQQ